MSKKTAPLPASSAGLLRFFEEDTDGFRLSPKIVLVIPISVIAISWVIDIFFAP